MTSIPRVILGDFQYVYAAEPDPANYHCLAHNVLANGLRGLVLPDRLAIGAKDGTAILHRTTAIGQHRISRLRQSANDVDVQCLTLDSWIQRLEVDVHALAFVKVDAQGSEADVLRGAPKLLSSPHIAWQLEFSPSLLKKAGSTAAELIELMERHFAWFIHPGTPTTPRARPIGEIREALHAMTGRFTDVVLYNTARSS
jgi:FkbM family methyltransferase